MKKTILLVLFSMYIPMCAQENKMRKKIEEVYHSFKKAAATGEEDKLAQYVSERFLITYKNKLAFHGITFNSDTVKNFGKHYDISKSSFVKMIKNGPTIGLVYQLPIFKDEQNKECITFQFLKFTQADNSWKYDGGFETTKLFKTENGGKATFSEDDIPEHLLIDGKIHLVTPLSKPVDFIGNLFIFGMGYTTIVSINGNKPITVNEGSHSGGVEGGLRTGKNTIRIEVRKQEQANHLYPSIKITYLDQNKVEKVAYTVDKKDEKTGVWEDTFMVE